MAKYSIGIDFGTLSGRAVIVDIETGKELASAVKYYAHAVITEQIEGKKLPKDWALQHPKDYIDVLSYTVPQVIKQSGVNPADIVGVGTDFTACTLLSVLNDGTPLCFLKEFQNNPHSYVKLWKHHSAQIYADKINKTAENMGLNFLQRYGGKVSCEWMLPKVMEIAVEAPEIYKKADKFIEASDWIVWQLTGKESRNSCAAGFKGLWNDKDGFPPESFFKALNPLLKNFVNEKIGCNVISSGSKAGEINETAAGITGLNKGTAVAAGIIDAHAGFLSSGITGKEEMFLITGTSNCHMILSDEGKNIKGVCGVVKDGILPGYYAYEAGQSCAGDHFDWFVKTCVPCQYTEEAKKQKKDIYTYLTEKAERLKAGESGLLALDWWNGNRSILMDSDLSGVIIGTTLSTKPEEIYRALIEATAFGTRKIIENFENNGVAIKKIIAGGGIAEKNQFAMQVYADVTGKEISLSASSQAGALGSAILGAAASGVITLEQAIKNMGGVKDKMFKPLKENNIIYDKLYAQYVTLHDYFGKTNNVMKELNNLKQ
jgi:L-ribulokinase